jgi:hypothetical protein
MCKGMVGGSWANIASALPQIAEAGGGRARAAPASRQGT